MVVLSFLQTQNSHKWLLRRLILLSTRHRAGVPNMAPSPTKAVYVKSTVAVANGVEETNPEERTVVAGAQYRIRSTSTSSPSTRSFASRSLRLPAHLFVTVRRLFHPTTTTVLRMKPTFLLTSLLLGNEHNAANYEELYSLGVTHICNVDFNARNYFEGKFVYIKLNLLDRAEEDVVKHFDGVSQFLEACDAVGGRALVHCCSGNALAPAFVIAYLMRKRKQTFAQAFDCVQRQRPTIQLYPNFHEQLRQYEAKLVAEVEADPQ